MPTIIGSIRDGELAKSGYSWAAVRDATSAANAYIWQSPGQAFVCDYPAPYNILAISRCFFAFDISDVSVAPTSATINFHGHNTDAANIIVVKATAPDLTTYIATADFDAIDGFVAGSSMSGNATDYSAAFSASSWNKSGWNAITLNAAALSDMAALDIFKIAVVEYDHDYLNVAPGDHAVRSTNMQTADHVSNKPYIDYAAPPPEAPYLGKRDEGRGEVGDLSAAVGNRDLYPTKQGVVAEPDFVLHHYDLDHVDANFSITDTTIANPRQAPFSKRFQLIRTLGSGKTTQG